MPAQRALVRLLLLLEAVEMVRQKLFRQGDVDLPLGLLHDFIRAAVPSIHRRRRIVRIETAGLFLNQLGIAGENSS